uniref:Tyrosine-protein phosphatase domain-containing protein n=1 Tax=Caenorhabditis tropicalis TaxID=1561998 RepID=A0A1I7T3C0_9PELO
MMTPTEFLRSCISRSWLENEIDGSIRQFGGTESNASQGGTGKSGTADGQAEEEEENRADITPMEAFNAVMTEGEALLSDMHYAAMIYPNTFDKCLNNMEMNRIPHLYCFDHTRVELTPQKGTGDYYHASWVDGYNKKSAYIFAQAPFDEITEHTFWRMVVEKKPSMILVFGDVDEKQKRKSPFDISERSFEKAFLHEFDAKKLDEGEMKAKLCSTFWPEKGSSKEYDTLSIQTKDEYSESHMKTFSLSVNDKKNASQTVLMHFHEWADSNQLPEYMLDMRASIKVQYIRSSKMPGANTGPIMLVCATGATKCAIYATIDIIVSRMTEEHTVGFKETMQAIKSQRFGCFRTPAPYLTAREMLMKFAVSTGVVHDTAIGDKPKVQKSKYSTIAKGTKSGFARKKKTAGK